MRKQIIKDNKLNIKKLALVLNNGVSFLVFNSLVGSDKMADTDLNINVDDEVCTKYY